MAIQFTSQHLSAIRRHGERAFPYECCGLLLGEWRRDGKIIHELWQVENTWDGAENPVADGESSQRRFLIDPLDFKRGHDYAHAKGWGVVGTYHSHPNHPAHPSEFDRQHAFPWGLSCVIVSVMAGEATELYSWILNDADQPEIEPLTLQQPMEQPQLTAIL
ncbi:MAG: M67 family metallopeptidase [Cyanobacteriota bacterium]|nr:M67 family metallopeptidase [Cyanobacteriota bacterium]